VRLIAAVFDALATFDRPCTRAELERESGLTKDQVHLGLRGLDRRHVLLVDGAARSRTVYQLLPGAQRPEDLRGKFARSDEFKALQSAARRGLHASRPATTAAVAAISPHGGQYSPARPASHGAAPGALRTHAPGVAAAPSAPLLLAQLWRRR
jgi:hypothetical protein